MARRSPRLALGTCSVLVSALACLFHPAPAMGPHDESEAHPCVLHVLHPQNMSRPARGATSIAVRSVSKCACVVLVHICTRPWNDATGSVRPLLARVLPLSYTAPDACPHGHKSPSTGRRACTSCQAPTRPAVTIQAGTGEKIVVQAQRREASPPDFAAGSLMAACPYLISFSMPSHVVFGVDAEQDGRGSATSGRSR